MTVTHNIVIVGAGHMGIAIFLGLKQSNLEASILIIEPNRLLRSKLVRAGINAHEKTPKLTGYETLILAIPPQAFSEFSKTCNSVQNHSGLIISVMAGIKLFELHKTLSATQLCRAMPNVPCAVAEGITVLCYAPSLSKENREIAQRLFSGIGKFLLAEEELFDSATALVGGGPAYVAYFANSLREYAIFSGFNENSAHQIVNQLLRGTSALLVESAEPPLDLCKKVMTAKGTTERAIQFFDEHQMNTIIVDGLKQASQRATLLGEGR
ncbi:pyrroline-5-carboxylate reductase family protein [Pseudomonas yamanorum]|jgi:pyrroline-5-carboxylate reductase|uniref:pyrroline-5-carboxylate reductase family protein n=1 Tax=Pseudomonas yamanorum TaxID=515393 RepID=UPI003B9DE60E